VVIGVISWDLHLAGSASLKDKRSVLKSLKARLHNEYNVSVAETGHHDLWQRAELTACLVATDRRHAESVISALDRFVEETDGCRVTDCVTSYL
jgi:uncharacterized protein YlxP (DUF503 family)